MFWNKSRKRIKELEADVSQVIDRVNELISANDELNSAITALDSWMFELQETNSQFKSEIESLKSKQSRKNK